MTYIFNLTPLTIFSIFLFLQILIIIRNLKNKRYQDFVYFCDFAPIILAFAFLLNFDQLTKSLINIGLYTQLIGLFTTILGPFVKIKLKGIPPRRKQSIYSKFIEFVVHIIPINFALLLTYQIKPEMFSLVYSVGILMLMFVFTIKFTPKKQNINFVHSSEFLGVKFAFYEKLWVIYAFILVVVPNYIIQYLIYIKFT